MSLGFDGIPGRLAAAIMARRNRPAEAEAIDRLRPAATDTVLVIGFGPGVGLKLLQPWCARICAVDPSEVMHGTAAKINRDALASGQLQLARTTAARLPWPAKSFDGALAVNSMQLWDPLPASIAEISRVLRPGARLVTLTHDWAPDRRRLGWLDQVSALCAEYGLTEATIWRGRAEHGRIIGFEVRRAPVAQRRAAQAHAGRSS